MKIEIICYKDHHYGWIDKEIKNLNDLKKYIDNGWLWYCETEERDEKVKITIETEEL